MPRHSKAAGIFTGITQDLHTVNLFDGKLVISKFVQACAGKCAVQSLSILYLDIHRTPYTHCFRVPVQTVAVLGTSRSNLLEHVDTEANMHSSSSSSNYPPSPTK